MRAALLVLLLLATAACQPLCSRTPNATGPTQNLVFTGPQAGTLASATTDCTTYASQKQANFKFDGLLGGKQLSMHIQVNGYTGAATYPVGSLLDGAGEIRLEIGDFIADSTTGAGTVTVDGDGKSGSVKADLIGGEHVEGTWQCDKLTAA
jgi:hypothetical protein